MESEPIKISGHHLPQIVLYFFEAYGNPEAERERLQGYYTKNIDKARELHEKLKNGAKIKIVAGPDDLCGLCDRDIHDWRCTDPKGNYFLTDSDINIAGNNDLEIGSETTLDCILQKFINRKRKSIG